MNFSNIETITTGRLEMKPSDISGVVRNVAVSKSRVSVTYADDGNDHTVKWSLDKDEPYDESSYTELLKALDAVVKARQ